MRFSFLLIIVAMSGCIGTTRYNRYLTEGYKTSPLLNIKNSPGIVVKLHSSISDTVPSVKTHKSQFIPAIIFWQWQKSISCSLPEKHQANKIESYLLKYSDSLQLEQNLNGRRIEITVDDAPANFTYTNKGNVLFLFIAYATSVSENMSPEFSDLKISYKLFKDDQVSKEGTITVLDKNEPARNAWKSTKKFTWHYLNSYENNVKAMSKEAIGKLLKEI
jgi:hypothetical protein